VGTPAGSPTAVAPREGSPAPRDRLRHCREQYHWDHLQMHDLLSAVPDFENKLTFSHIFFLLANLMLFFISSSSFHVRISVHRKKKKKD